MSGQTTEFKDLLDAVPGALVGVDQAGVIRYVNHQTEALFGYDRDELVGKPVETLVPESFRPEHPAHREACFARLEARRQGPDREATTDQGRVVFPDCLRGRQRDGTEFPLNISLSHIDTQDGRLAIAAVRDLTDRTKSRESHDLMIHLAAIVEHSDDAIIGKTLEGVITSWNPAAESIYGYSSREMIGKSVELLSPKDRTGEVKAILAKIKAGEHVDHFETIHVRKDATAITVSLTVSPIRNADGATVGASSIARDVAK